MATLAWLALRVFGFVAWNKHRKEHHTIEIIDKCYINLN